MVGNSKSNLIPLKKSHTVIFAFIQAQYPHHEVTVSEIHGYTLVDILVPNIWNVSAEEILSSTMMHFTNESNIRVSYGSLDVLGVSIFGM